MVQDGKPNSFEIQKNCFPLRCILSIVDIFENYTFSPQFEIQAKYYHLDQIANFIQVSYRHVQFEVDGVESIDLDECIIIKEVYFYISDDRVHDRSYVAHCFGMFFDDLTNRGINALEHWIWFDGCASKCISKLKFEILCTI